MRQSICGDTRISALGFGCGSVLGRVGRKASQRAMHVAFEEGVTFFDTARSYGYGEAEAVLGEFLRGRRDRVVVATKYGVAPQPLSSLKRLAIPIVRSALSVPGARKAMRRGSTRPPMHGVFSVAGLRQSTETSLRELRTDYVDMLFLHNATVDVLNQADVLHELEALVQAGKVLRVGLYAAAEVAREALASRLPVLNSMQFGADPGCQAPVMPSDNSPALLIGNHPFGGERRVAWLQQALATMSADPTVPVELRDKLRGASWSCVLDATFALILSKSVHAIVLSMMRPEHIRSNVRAVESSRFTADDLIIMQERLKAAKSLSGA